MEIRREKGALQRIRDLVFIERRSRNMACTVEKWKIFEYEMKGPADGNPFVDVKLEAVFQSNGRKVRTFGFYDGEGVYKVRFMPDETGEWAFEIRSNADVMDGLTGTFECIPASAENHGPVRVKNRYHFAYEDGVPYIPVGTTCYAWTHQGDKLEEKTLETLKKSPFNKIRMCVFPKHYDYNHNEPVYYPFEGTPPTGWNFERFNPAFFRHLEMRIGQLDAAGIEADVILLHPYDNWGFSTMAPDDDDRYLRYVVARLAPYKNVWWSLANEFDFMKGRDMTDWDRYFKIVQESDPYQHLRSVHNGKIFYDHGKPWVTHCSIQHSDLTKVNEWRAKYGKPVVVDECCYEGNIGHMWGNLTPREMVSRFWEGFARGGYVGHGETYVDSGDVLWWAKGGTLRGESPERLAFLRKIMEDGPKGGIDPLSIGRDVRAVSGSGDSYFLAYCGAGQSAYKDLALPEGGRYQIDVIDTWNMQIRTLEKTFEGNCRVPLNGKQYLALRIRKV